MPEVALDLAEQGLIREPTSTTSERIAVLAAEALAGRFRAALGRKTDFDRGTSVGAVFRTVGDGVPHSLSTERGWVSTFSWGELDHEFALLGPDTNRVLSLTVEPENATAELYSDRRDDVQWSASNLVPQDLGEDLGSAVSTDEMSSDQHLVFLSLGDVPPFLQPIVTRIKDLARLARDEEDQQALKPRSLRGLFRFLYVHQSRIRVRPQLILTSEGLLRGIWRRSRDYRVAVRFLDDSTVSFVTFLPDRVRPTRINRVGGESSIDGFFASVGIEELLA